MDASKKFYGKWVVLACALIGSIPVALVNKTATFYMAPVIADFGFTVGSFSVVYAIAAAGAAAGAITVGKYLNKVNIRYLMAAGGAVAGTCFIGVSFATQLWHFYILFAIMDFALGALSSVPLSYLVANWYKDKRGLMTSLVFVGMNLGGAIVSPIIEKIINNYSWQTAAQVSGVLVMIVAIPVSLFIVRRDPASMGQEPYTDPESKKKAKDQKIEETEDKHSGFDGVSKEVAKKSAPFYLLALGLIFLGIVAGGIMVHIPNYLTMLGMDYGIIIAVLSIASIFGTLLNGVLFDKIGALGGMFVTTVLLIVGCIALFLVDAMPILAYLMAITVGFSICAASTAPPLLTSAMFGMKAYSELFGLQYAMFLVGCIIGPIASGAMFTATGSYSSVWIGFMGSAVGMFVAIFFAAASAKRLMKSEAAKESNV